MCGQVGEVVALCEDIEDGSLVRMASMSMLPRLWSSCGSLPKDGSAIESYVKHQKHIISFI